MINSNDEPLLSLDSKLKSLSQANHKLKDALKDCTICPRRCHKNRLLGQKGYCRAPANPVIYSYTGHHGEEPPISGNRGSGTIFFSHCNMKCVYCQNYYFSQLDDGREVTVESLATIMLRQQENGCHNINLVSPTHFIPQILIALEIALKAGLRIPIVYNTGGYEAVDTIRLLDGIIDIYLPDMRYSENAMSLKYSDACDYVDHNRASVIEMHRQVKDLTLDQNGIAVSGLIVRLLALPGNISGTRATMKFIADNISKNTYLSIMSQYYPTFKAYNFKELSAAITHDEYENIVDEARVLQLNNGWIQDAPSKTDPGLLGTNIKPKRDI